MNYAPTPRWALGMRKIGPGIYIDGQGSAHFDPPSFCLETGYPPTPENMRAAEDAARAAFGEMYPGIQVTEK